jgi:transcription elongation factor GreB
MSRPRSPRPGGSAAPAVQSPNYITPAGARRLSEELGGLRTERIRVVQEVQDAAAQGDRSENAEYIYGKKRLREIDRRMTRLTRRLSVAVVVDPGAHRGDPDRIFFGATVDVEEEDGTPRSYRIVGEDEVDGGSGDISWRSPIGRALLGKRLGDAIKVRRPAGEVEMEIVGVRYVAEVS